MNIEYLKYIQTKKKKKKKKYIYIYMDLKSL